MNVAKHTIMCVHGYGDVPKHVLRYLEYKEELIKLGKNLYKKVGVSD